MPKSFNGIGTSYYGQASPRSDRSFVTTEWFMVIFLPIIPLRSYRVVRETTGDRLSFFGHSASYSVLERLPLAWIQVMKTYFFAVLCIGWWITCTVVGGKFLSEWRPTKVQQWMLLIFVAPVPFYLLGLFRHFAKRAALKREIEAA